MVFSWEGEREKRWWDLDVLSPDILKCFLPKMGRKLEGGPGRGVGGGEKSSM